MDEYSMMSNQVKEMTKNVCIIRHQSCFVNKEVCLQRLKISGKGDKRCLPKGRKLTVKFKNIPNGEIFFKENGIIVKPQLVYDSIVALSIDYNANTEYCIEVRYTKKSLLQKLKDKASRVLAEFEETFEYKEEVYGKLMAVSDIEGFESWTKVVNLSKRIREYLNESIR